MLSTYDLCPCDSRKKFKFCCRKDLSKGEVSKIAPLLPLSCCYVNSSWKVDKLAALFVVRFMGSNEFLLGSFLIDLLGLGIKCADVEIGMTSRRLGEWISQFPMETLPYEEARSLVLGAADFSIRWGFSPHKGYENARYLIEPNRPYQKMFEFGENGRPLCREGVDNGSFFSLNGRHLQPEEEISDHDWCACEEEIGQILSAYIGEKPNRSKLIEIAAEEYLSSWKASPNCQEFAPLFSSWLYYRRQMDPSFSDEVHNEGEKKTISQACLEEHPERFTKDQKEFIHRAYAAPYSFYLVEEAVLSHQLKLRDILLEEERHVEGYRGIEDALPGMILFGRLVDFGDQSIWLGQAPQLLPNDCLPYLEEMRGCYADKCKISPQALLALDLELRLVYWKLLEQAHLTKDEINRPIEILYALKCAPKEAFHKLASLSALPPEEILQDAYFDDRSRLSEVTFFWEKSSGDPDCLVDSVTLARLTILEGSLKVHVNSDKEAEKIKREIKKRLGKRAV